MKNKKPTLNWPSVGFFEDEILRDQNFNLLKCYSKTTFSYLTYLPSSSFIKCNPGVKSSKLIW